MITLHKIIMSTLQGNSFLVSFEKASAYIGEVCMARNLRESPANGQQETAALNPICHNELSSSTTTCPWN